jgi:hypothetical protein
LALEPFVRLDEHLTDAAEHQPVDEADFLVDRLAELRTKYELIKPDLLYAAFVGAYGGDITEWTDSKSSPHSVSCG